MTTIGIIPARYASTRFPGKPLADIGGKPMIQRVYEQAKRSRLDRVYVATDDARIVEAVQQFGGEVLLTGEHPNGTARCIAAFRGLDTEAELLVNIQGDEPFIQPDQIDALLGVLTQSEAPIATLAKPLTSRAAYLNPNVVKLVGSPTAQAGIYRAHYFSRAPIPYVQDQHQLQAILIQQRLFHHVGLYGFHRSFVEQYEPSVSPLSALENLEQLTWLEQGYGIHFALTHRETPAIDTPIDLVKALDWLRHYGEPS